MVEVPVGYEQLVESEIMFETFNGIYDCGSSDLKTTKWFQVAFQQTLKIMNANIGIK